MKTFLRFAKLFSAFFFILTAVYFSWTNYHFNQLIAPGYIGISEKIGFPCIFLAAIGLAILWQDWRTTR